MAEEISGYDLFTIIISLHGFFLAALMAVGQLAVQRKSIKNLLYLDLFILFGLIQGHIIIWKTGMGSEHIFLQNLNIPAIYAAGPIIYLFTRFSLGTDNRLRLSHFVHYFPPIIMYAVVIGVSVLTPRHNSGGYLDGIFHNPFTFGIWAAGSAVLSVYLIAVFIELKRAYIFERGLPGSSFQGKVTTVVYCIMVFSALCLIYSVVSRSSMGIEISNLSITAVIIFLFLVNFKYPEFYQDIHRAVKEEKAKRTYLSGIDSETVVSRLKQLMDEDQIFADEDISLPSTAALLEINPHQLSELINSYFGMNFTAYINIKRIEKAKELLVLDNESPVISIAFEAGFKSKSAFNSAFRKAEGMTPSEFRRSRTTL